MTRVANGTFSKRDFPLGNGVRQPGVKITYQTYGELAKYGHSVVALRRAAAQINAG